MIEFCSGSDTLYGLDRWTMISIFAGGGLVLLLTIVLVTVACRQCKRRVKQQRGELSLRFCEMIIISCDFFSNS